jgi:hypothetical protein
MLQVASFGGGNDNKNPPILHTSPDNRFDAGNLLGVDERITGLAVFAPHAKRSKAVYIHYDVKFVPDYSP